MTSALDVREADDEAGNKDDNKDESRHDAAMGRSTDTKDAETDRIRDVAEEDACNAWMVDIDRTAVNADPAMVINVLVEC